MRYRKDASVYASATRVTPYFLFILYRACRFLSKLFAEYFLPRTGYFRHCFPSKLGGIRRVGGLESLRIAVIQSELCRMLDDYFVFEFFQSCARLSDAVWRELTHDRYRRIRAELFRDKVQRGYRIIHMSRQHQVSDYQSAFHRRFSVGVRPFVAYAAHFFERGFCHPHIVGRGGEPLRKRCVGILKIGEEHVRKFRGASHCVGRFVTRSIVNKRMPALAQRQRALYCADEMRRRHEVDAILRSVEKLREPRVRILLADRAAAYPMVLTVRAFKAATAEKHCRDRTDARLFMLERVDGLCYPRGDAATAKPEPRRSVDAALPRAVVASADGHLSMLFLTALRTD